MVSEEPTADGGILEPEAEVAVEPEAGVEVEPEPDTGGYADLYEPITGDRSDQYTRTDLEHLAGGPPVELNLGCGEDDTGVGIDINYSPDITHDLDEGIPCADDSADAIRAEHVLEHLENPTQFVAECRRVLRDDGRLRLELPNVGWWPVRLWLTQDLQRFWSHKDPDRDGHWLARRLGNPDERRTAHRTLWTPQLLREYLDRHGFDYEIDGWHGSRNLSVTATPDTGDDAGRTLHELERAHGDDLASQDYWAQTRVRIIREWVRDADPKRVLDAGCGSGYLAATLADDLGCDVVGIDIAEESIDVAQRRDTDARFHVADLHDLDGLSGGFDVVIFADVLEHFETPETALSAAADTLAPGGSIIVSLPAHSWLWGPHDEHNDHHRRYDADELARVAQNAGLTVSRSRHTNLLPLVPYALYQRVLRRPVPDSARGGHGRVVEGLKRAAIRCETAVKPPVGITLIGELVQE